MQSSWQKRGGKGINHYSKPMYHRHGTAAMSSESDISCLWHPKEGLLYQSRVPGVYVVGVLSLSFGVLKIHETMECFRGDFVTAMLKLTSIRWWRFVPQKLKCSWEWCNFLVGEQSDRCAVRAFLKWQLACYLCFRLFFGRSVNTFFGT